MIHKAQLKILPLLLILVNLLCLFQIVSESKLLNTTAAGESWFVFSSMAFLVQPIPVLLIWLLSKSQLFEKILYNPFGMILYAGLAGSIQWYLIGSGILKHFPSKTKHRVFNWLVFLTLLSLALVMVIYTLSISIGLDDLRPQIEKCFFLTWMIAVIILLIYFTKQIILMIVKHSTASNSKVTAPK
jgi:hypothetical protein